MQQEHGSTGPLYKDYYRAYRAKSNVISCKVLVYIFFIFRYFAPSDIFQVVFPHTQVFFKLCPLIHSPKIFNKGDNFYFSGLGGGGSPNPLFGNFTFVNYISFFYEGQDPGTPDTASPPGPAPRILQLYRIASGRSDRAPPGPRHTPMALVQFVQ